MAVVIKSKGLQFLAKMGISQIVVEALKAKGVTLALGPKNFVLYAPDNSVLASGDFAMSSTDLLSPAAPYSAKKSAKESLTLAASDALKANVLNPDLNSVAGSPVQAAALLLEPAVTSAIPEAVKVDPASVLVPEPVVIAKPVPRMRSFRCAKRPRCISGFVARRAVRCMSSWRSIRRCVSRREFKVPILPFGRNLQAIICSLRRT